MTCISCGGIRYVQRMTDRAHVRCLSCADGARIADPATVNEIDVATALGWEETVTASQARAKVRAWLAEGERHGKG